jgi:glycine/D-amino acid oxidase-like deaminating enzyme
VGGVSGQGVRICVVGGGLAGSLLAWRLAQAGAGQIDLALGASAPPAGAAPDAAQDDATEASGGVVRGFEPDPAVSQAAVASLVELRASPMLRRWSAYHEVGSLYVRDSPAVPAAQLAELERALPGSADPLAAGPLAARGWSGLPPYCTGVSERHAGYISPGALRRAVLADLAGRQAAHLLPVTVSGLRLRPDGQVRSQARLGRRDYDLVAVAAGRWTGRLLRHSGLPHAGLRTKSIQYTVYAAAGWRPPPFVDETSGLYGRPVGTDALLLGMPVQQWDVDPDRPPDSPAPHMAAARWAAVRFPRLRLGPPLRRAAAADSYSPGGTLSLQPVAGTDDRIFTFAGGSGGSVKTALAASRLAAADLAARLHTRPREGISQ